jgi:hypothetical protein
MEAKLTITQSPQLLAGDAVRPAAPPLRKLTSILAARPRPMRLLNQSQNGDAHWHERDEG